MSEKQQVTKPPQPAKPALRKDGVPVNVTPLRNDTAAATQAFIRQKVYEGRSYLRKAFANPYNLTLLAGGLAASALTLNPLLAVVTVGLEILWVVNAPGSKKLQEWLWDPQFDAEEQAKDEAAGTRTVIAKKPVVTAACEWMVEAGVKRCGFDAVHTTVAALESMRKAVPARVRRGTFVAVESLVARLREVRERVHAHRGRHRA